MSAPKTTPSIKVPPFTRDDFSLWKMKMLLFIKASNPLYIGVLENRPFVPMKPVSESTAPDGTRIPQVTQPKDNTEYTDSDKELIRLDTCLMLILADSVDKEMSYQSLPGEIITQVFEKYTKLLNELAMKGKTYPLRETNRKFMMTLPHHVEQKSSSIRERIYFTKMSLEMIYGKLKTYEMEQEQRVIIYGPGTVDNNHNALVRSATLVVDEPATSDIQVQTPRAGNEVIIEAEMDSVNLGVDESDYYTLEELEQMEDKTMAFQKSKYAPSTCFKGGYKTGSIEVYERKDSYEDLKKENAKLKQQLEAFSGKQKGKSYIAEGKHWDNTDSDEEEEYVNVALMADYSEESPQLSQVPILMTIDMSNSEYKKTVQDLSVELFNVHTSMLAS
ncbi:hypothetical protein POM88_024761 [Heracleum sosnowskyi]|uniref:Uncharacterized protein n=1 Tax=Heracleum sosnowskyi TaxID=360622 RepID=A0AAD8MMD1_9APIA|nr:hypothetical protein POM88_024761 [Heracleum sosnowskyi]